MKMLAAKLFGVGGHHLLGFLLVYVKAKTRALRKLDVAVSHNPRLLEHSFAKSDVDLFLNEEVGDSGVHLHAR